MSEIKYACEKCVLKALEGKTLEGKEKILDCYKPLYQCVLCGDSGCKGKSMSTSIYLELFYTETNKTTEEKVEQPTEENDMVMRITKFNNQCTQISNHDCEIYFLRHAQSLANVGCEWIIDSPLSEEGIIQAKLVKGKFNLVLCSPCRRTKETLHYSTITYDQLIIAERCREMVQTPTSQLVLEQRNDIFRCEDINHFWKRASEFQQELENYCKQYKDNNIKAKILIISHGFFFNAWYRKGCFETPPNAQIMRLY